MPPLRYRRLLQAAALGLAALLTLGLSGLLSPRLAPRYTVTDLGVLPGDSASRATVLNSRGDVAGFTQGPHRQSCVFQNGAAMSIRGLPGGSDSYALGINSQGEVIGDSGSLTSHHAFVYSGGKTRALGTLPGFKDSEGAGINDRGEAVGTASTSPGPTGFPHQHAFFYRAGRMMDIGTPPGCSESQATSINAAGQVAGDGLQTPGRIDQPRPLLYDSRTGTMKMLLMPPARGGWAFHINDKGQVIGTVWTHDDRYHVVLWGGGRMRDLGTAPGFADSFAQGLNNRGEAVGFSSEGVPAQDFKAFLRNHAGGDSALRRYLARPSERAFVYREGKMQDLNDLVPKDADWILEEARGINDRGQIVGRGLHHGQERGFLLTPR